MIEPASVTVAAGQEAFFGAALYDAYGNRVVNRNPECTVVWTVPAPATTFTPPKYVTTIYVRSQVSVPVTVTCGAASNTAQYIVS